jgi:hypothetical protein
VRPAAPGGRSARPGARTIDPADQAASRPAGGSANADDAPPPEDPPQVLTRTFDRFSALTVAGAGLIDGVNPCAFTTIIFLLSMLGYLGKTRRQLVIVGVGFTSAVFITYFLLGLGLLGAVKTFAVSQGLSRGLAYAVAGLTFLLAIWSFIDFLRYIRSRDTRTVTLGLPKSIKQRIHTVIRKGLKTRNLLIGSISVGVLVSILESMCTGQVYLPTLVYIIQLFGLRVDAIGYLLLYYLMFILPLVAILAVAYAGISSDRLGQFLRRHLGWLKLALACLFALLATVVLWTA